VFQAPIICHARAIAIMKKTRRLDMVGGRPLEAESAPIFARNFAEHQGIDVLARSQRFGGG
jgi:hypothetical protein